MHRRLGADLSRCSALRLLHSGQLGDVRRWAAGPYPGVPDAGNSSHVVPLLRGFPRGVK